MASVGIIGGGIIGLAAGVALSKAGHGVTLFDPAHKTLEPSWANAGHIACEQVSPLSSIDQLASVPRRLFCVGGALDLPWSAIGLWAPFALEYLKACLPSRHRAGEVALAGLLEHALKDWQDLAREIQAPELVRDGGHFVVWESPASARRGRAAWSLANTGRTGLHSVSPDQARQLDGLTAVQVHGGVHFTGSGHVADLAQLKAALEKAFSARGGRLVSGYARLDLEDGRARVNSVPFDEVIVAAGTNSGKMMKLAGHRVPLIAERGYHLRAGLDDCAAVSWPKDLPPIVFEDRSLIVTRYAQAVQVSSFVEFNAANAPADERKWSRLERHISQLGLPVEGPFDKWVGSRPTLPDYLPAIGRSDRARNLIYAFGHQHLGLTLAATTRRMLVALVQNDSPPVDLASLSLNRFEQKLRQ